MINLSEQLININKTVSYRVKGLIFSVIILDFKISYGVLRYSITPLKGCGKIWVNSDSITMQNEKVRYNTF